MWEHSSIQMQGGRFAAAHTRTQVNGQKAECEAEAAKIEVALVLYDGPLKRGLQDLC